jgi:DNA anti-recombination protein RmuC
VATLEDAAEELVLKLRGLDSEIEESEEKLEHLRERVEKSAGKVEQQWAELREAASSLLDKVRGEQEQLRQQCEETAQAVVGAQNAVAEEGAQAQQELSEGRGQLEALREHAAGLDPGVESLAAEAGEAPARSLAERARAREEELDRLVEEARSFIQDEVVGAATEMAEQVRQVCDTLQHSLAEAAAEALQKVTTNGNRWWTGWRSTSSPRPIRPRNPRGASI